MASKLQDISVAELLQKLQSDEVDNTAKLILLRL
jgi:hypothetical protein